MSDSIDIWVQCVGVTTTTAAPGSGTTTSTAAPVYYEVFERIVTTTTKAPTLDPWCTTSTTPGPAIDLWILCTPAHTVTTTTTTAGAYTVPATYNTTTIAPLTCDTP